MGSTCPELVKFYPDIPVPADYEYSPLHRQRNMKIQDSGASEHGPPSKFNFNDGFNGI